MLFGRYFRLREERNQMRVRKAAIGIVTAGVVLLGWQNTAVAATDGPDFSGKNVVVMNPDTMKADGGATADGGFETYGTNQTAYTTDAGDPGGRAVFDADTCCGERLRACDMQGDGRRAVAYLNWSVGDTVYLLEWWDDNGADNGCEQSPYLNISEGRAVWVKACLRDGQYGADVACSGWERGTA